MGSVRESIKGFILLDSFKMDLDLPHTDNKAHLLELVNNPLRKVLKDQSRDIQ